MKRFETKVLQKIEEKIRQLRRKADDNLKYGYNLEYAYLCNEIKGLAYAKGLLLKSSKGEL